MITPLVKRMENHVHIAIYNESLERLEAILEGFTRWNENVVNNGRFTGNFI